MERIDGVIIGAGVVGLAIARALALRGRDVLVLEAMDAIGTGASSRNSEVVHGGLYYAPGSLKARLAVRGRSLLYEYCRTQGIAHRQCGKLIVAVDQADATHLDAIAARARANGVHELERLGRAQVAEMEPEVACVAALWSPVTGIVDSHGLMTSLRADIAAHGGAVVCRTAVRAAHRVADRWMVSTSDDAGIVMAADWIVNAAGIDAQAVAHTIAGFPASHIPVQHLAKGHYFALGGAVPFTHLVYPTPKDGGLGIHLTLDLAGQARFGPDVEWLRPGDGAWNYAVDASRAEAFVRDIRRYWPEVPAASLRPAYAGVRSKLSGPGEAVADFRIDGPDQHGVPGVVQLFGIESPGLTASLAIGEYVADLVTANVVTGTAVP